MNWITIAPVNELALLRRMLIKKGVPITDLLSAALFLHDIARTSRRTRGRYAVLLDGRLSAAPGLSARIWNRRIIHPEPDEGPSCILPTSSPQR